MYLNHYYEIIFINDLGTFSSTYQEITTANVITAASGVGISSAKASILGPFVIIYIVGSGSLTISAAGNVTIGTVAEKYRPNLQTNIASRVNGNSSGQSYKSCNFTLSTDGTLRIMGAGLGSAIGSSSYAWTTNDGLTLFYHL